MKKVLVVCAMDVERALLLSYLSEKKDITLANGATLTIGLLGSKKVGILLCGIGKVNASIGLTLALSIEEESFDLVVNSGVAGGLLAIQNPSDMVIGSFATYHDVDVSSFGYKKGQLPNGPEFFTCDENTALFLYNKSMQHGNNTHMGLVVSGDQFINTTAQVETIKANFSEAVCVEMEAAAIAHTCHVMKKPFVIIRALSDKADSSAKSDYGAFVAIASKKSSILVRDLVEFL